MAQTRLIRPFGAPLPGWLLRYGLWLIVILSLVLHFAAWQADPVLSRDGVYYVELARKWHESANFGSLVSKGFYVPPLLLFVMKKAEDWGLSPVMIAVWVNMVSSTLLIVIGYGIARSLSFTREMALWAALLLAVHPVLGELSYAVQRESLYLFFTALGAWGLIAGERHARDATVRILHMPFGWKWGWGCAGVCWSLALFTRHEALELLAGLLIALIWCVWTHRMIWRQACLRLTFFMVFGIAGWAALHFGMGIPVKYYASVVETRIEQQGWEE